MKRILLIFSVILLTLSACDKAFVNGYLDGMWRLERVVAGDEELAPQNIYYSFQRHIVMFGEYYEEASPFLYMGVFERDGDTLKMNSFKEYPGVEDICDAVVLERFYIFDVSEVVFTVKTLNDETLVMQTGGRVYYFRKW